MSMTRSTRSRLTGVLTMGLAGALLSPSGAIAQATVAEAARLESDLTAWLGSLDDRDPHSDVVLDGPVSITPTGSRYTGFLPTSRWISRHPHGVTMIEVPTVRFRLTVLDNDWIDVDATLPERFGITTHDDPEITVEALLSDTAAATTDVAWTPEEATFVIAPEYGAAIQASLAASDLSIRNADTALAITIGSAVYIVESTATDEHAYDSTTTLSVEDLAAGDGEGALTLSGVAATVVIEDGRYDLFTAWAERLATLQHGIEAGAMEESQITGEMAALLDTDAPLASAIGSTFALDGLQIRDGADNVLDLAALTIGSRLGDLDRDRAVYDFDFSLGGLTRTPEPEVAALLPDAARLDLTISEIPSERIAALLTDFITTLGSAPGARDFASMTFGIGLYSALSEAQATLTIDEFAYVSDILEIDFRGTVAPDIAAPLGVVVDAEFGASKLPQLIAAMTALGGTGAQIAAALTVLQGLGEVEESADGTIRRYRLEIRPDGTVLLNHNDLGPILNAL